MRELSRFFAHVSYQGFFVIEQDDDKYSLSNTFVFVSRIIHTWVKDKFPQVNVPDKPYDFHKDYYSVSVSVFYSYDELKYCMITKHPDEAVPNRVWITEAELSVSDGELTLAVRNQYTSLETEKDYNLCSPPGFVYKLAKKLNLTDAGRTLTSLSVVDSEEAVFDLHCLVDNKVRQFPVVVISENKTRNAMEEYFETDDGYHIDGAKLAKDLYLIAHVFYLPLSFQEQWIEEVGNEYGVYAGAVRTYYPGYDPEKQTGFSHPFMSSQKILRMSYTDSKGRELLAGHAFRHILTHKLKIDCMCHRTDWKSLGVDFYYRSVLNRKQEREELHHLSEEILDTYKKQVEDLENIQNQVENDNEELREQLNTARSTIWQNQIRIQQLEGRLKELGETTHTDYPDSFDKIPNWVEENYAGRVFLHNRAKKALKSAVYKDVEFVCRVINLLGTSYYQMKNSQISIEQYAEALNDLKIQDAITASDISAGMQGDEYYVIHNGRRRMMEKHLKNGTSRDPRETFRLYYFWDDDERQVVIGYLPDHLRTRNS